MTSKCDRQQRRAQQLARDLGVSTDDGIVEVLKESQVRIGMYDNLRDRLPEIVSRELTLCSAQDRDRIQQLCLSARDHPHNRFHVFPAYTHSLKLPTDMTRLSREGALIPVTQKALPPKPPSGPGVSVHDPVEDVGVYAFHVLYSIERMILGKGSRLPDGSVVNGLTNHRDRQRRPALDWSVNGREESLELLEQGSRDGTGPVLYGTRFADEDWADASSSCRSVAEEIRRRTRGRAHRSPFLEEGEAVLIEPSRPKCSYPPCVPIVFERLPPTLVERRPKDFDPNPPPEDERGEPWLTVMSIAGPWIPEPASIIHFGGAAADSATED